MPGVSLAGRGWIGIVAKQPRALARKKRRTAWTAAEFDKDSVSVDYEGVMNSDEGLFELLEHIDATGVAVVTGVPGENLAVVGLAERVAFLEESHFGRYFDVESKPEPRKPGLYAAGVISA